MDDPSQPCPRFLSETHRAVPGTQEVGWKYGHPCSLFQLPQSPMACCVQPLLIHVKAASHPQSSHSVGGGWDNQGQCVGCSYRWTNSQNLPGGASEKPQGFSLKPSPSPPGAIPRVKDHASSGFYLLPNLTPVSGWAWPFARQVLLLDSHFRSLITSQHLRSNLLPKGSTVASGGALSSIITISHQC